MLRMSCAVGVTDVYVSHAMPLTAPHSTLALTFLFGRSLRCPLSLGCGGVNEADPPTSALVAAQQAGIGETWASLGLGHSVILASDTLPPEL